MKRVVVVAIAVILAVMSPSAVPAQGFGGPGGILPSAFFSAIPRLGELDLGSIRVVPRVDVGYQKIGFSLNVPVPYGFSFGIPTVGPVDLTLRDSNVWVGSVGFDAQIGPRLSLFVTGQANAKRDVTVEEGESPSIFVPVLGLALPLQRTGTGLEWWAIDGGAAWRIRDDLSLIGGFRQDHLSVGLGGPRTADGQSLDLNITIPGIFSFVTRYRGDVQTKLSIPYFGVRFDGFNYRASVILSPFVWARAKVPLRGSAIIGVPIVPLEIDLFNEWRFSLSKPAFFLEGKSEYDVEVYRGGGLSGSGPQGTGFG